MRIRPVALSLFGGLIFNVSSTSLAEERDNAKDLLLKEHPAVAKSLEDAYSHATAIGKITSLDQEDVVDVAMIFDVARKKGAFRLMLTVVKASESNMDHSPPGLCAVFGGTAEKYFEVNRKPGEAKHRFHWYGPRPDLAATERLKLPVMFAATCLGDASVADVLGNKDITIKSASFATFEGKKVVTMEYEVRDPQNGKWRSEGIIRLSQPGWAVVTWRSIIWDATSKVAPEDQGFIFEKHVEYSELEPITKVQKVKSWRSKAGKKLDHGITEVKELKFGDAPDGAFDLKTYDIPEPDHVITPNLEDHQPKKAK